MARRLFRHRSAAHVLVVIAAALAMGFVSAKWLFGGSALNTIPWGVLALATGLSAPDRRQALRLGGTWGFMVSFSFLLFDNSDPKTLSRLLVLVPLAAFAALFGLLCGWLAGWLGWQLRKLLGRSDAGR